MVLLKLIRHTKLSEFGTKRLCSEQFSSSNSAGHETHHAKHLTTIKWTLGKRVKLVLLTVYICRPGKRSVHTARKVILEEANRDTKNFYEASLSRNTDYYCCSFYEEFNFPSLLNIPQHKNPYVAFYLFQKC
jgi:hypothetical protein